MKIRQSLIAFAFAFTALPCVTAVGQQSAQVAQGASLYQEHCSRCHGADGKRGEGYQTPVWGPGSQIAKFEHAQGMFEYVQMLMPFDDPSKVADQQKWDIISFMLARHGAIQTGDTLDAARARSVPIK